MISDEESGMCFIGYFTGWLCLVLQRANKMTQIRSKHTAFWSSQWHCC